MISGALLDLSGVIYVGNTVLPGSLAAVERLRAIGLPVRFLTNTTRTPKRLILNKLHDLGLTCEEEELFTPARAACDWLKSHGRSPHLLIHRDLAEDFAELPKSEPRAVVIGDAGEAFTYRTLNEAFRHLMAGAEFLALAGNRTFLDKDAQLSLDAGAFVAALEYGTQRAATVLGKPSADFFAAALASMGCPAKQAVMVGDDAEADVSGALAAGLGVGLLVKTGKYIPGAEDRVDPPPSDTVDDLAAAVDWIISQRTGSHGSHCTPHH